MNDREKLIEAMARAIGEKYGYRAVEGGYYIFVGALQRPMPVDNIAEVALTAIEAAGARLTAENEALKRAVDFDAHQALVETETKLLVMFKMLGKILGRTTND